MLPTSESALVNVQTLQITLVTVCTTYFNIYKSSHLTYVVQLGVS